jgi:hypothetical protein
LTRGAVEVRRGSSVLPLSVLPSLFLPTGFAFPVVVVVFVIIAALGASWSLSSSLPL